MLVLELIAQGLVQGSIYALIALGLTLVYGLLRILHVAHAAVFTLGAYVGCILTNQFGGLMVGIPGAMMVSGIVGMALYRFCLSADSLSAPVCSPHRLHRTLYCSRGNIPDHLWRHGTHLPGSTPAGPGHAFWNAPVQCGRNCGDGRICCHHRHAWLSSDPDPHGNFLPGNGV